MAKRPAGHPQSLGNRGGRPSPSPTSVGPAGVRGHPCPHKSQAGQWLSGGLHLHTQCLRAAARGTGPHCELLCHHCCCCSVGARWPGPGSGHAQMAKPANAMHPAPPQPSPCTRIPSQGPHPGLQGGGGGSWLLVPEAAPPAPPACWTGRDQSIAGELLSHLVVERGAGRGSQPGVLPEQGRGLAWARWGA